MIFSRYSFAVLLILNSLIFAVGVKDTSSSKSETRSSSASYNEDKANPHAPKIEFVDSTSYDTKPYFDHPLTIIFRKIKQDLILYVGAIDNEPNEDITQKIYTPAKENFPVTDGDEDNRNPFSTHLRIILQPNKNKLYNVFSIIDRGIQGFYLFIQDLVLYDILEANNKLSSIIRRYVFNSLATIKSADTSSTENEIPITLMSFIATETKSVTSTVTETIFHTPIIPVTYITKTTLIEPTTLTTTIVEQSTLTIAEIFATTTTTAITTIEATTKVLNATSTSTVIETSMMTALGVSVEMMTVTLTATVIEPTTLTVSEILKTTFIEPVTSTILESSTSTVVVPSTTTLTVSEISKTLITSTITVIESSASTISEAVTSTSTFVSTATSTFTTTVIEPTTTVSTTAAIEPTTTTSTTIVTEQTTTTSTTTVTGSITLTATELITEASTMTAPQVFLSNITSISTATATSTVTNIYTNRETITNTLTVPEFFVSTTTITKPTTLTVPTVITKKLTIIEPITEMATFTSHHTVNLTTTTTKTITCKFTTTLTSTNMVFLTITENLTESISQYMSKTKEVAPMVTRTKTVTYTAATFAPHQETNEIDHQLSEKSSSKKYSSIAFTGFIIVCAIYVVVNYILYGTLYYLLNYASDFADKVENNFPFNTIYDFTIQLSNNLSLRGDKLKAIGVLISIVVYIWCRTVGYFFGLLCCFFIDIASTIYKYKKITFIVSSIIFFIYYDLYLLFE